ncbi:methionyl-tRNA formyltransferase [Flavobacteriaceae bacterium UJ101]|nr:methionyl-tRNA formyltransferase [Flavobacteriaceae bacterium UJ101]
MNNDTRIVFMGTPDFATGCLKKLVENRYNIVGVVTVADKPAGRGKKISQSSVKKYAQEHHLPILQPTNLKDENFLKELKELKADLQIVVAFRMLPEAVWKMPTLGTFNLHASLLPDYRGAAPINWAIINGDQKSGVTTFMIDEKIDTGEILLQKEVPISENMTAGALHDELLYTGAELILETVDGLIQKNIKPQPQPLHSTFKKAPKIFKNDCKINWNDTLENIHNFIRGLSPYPGAWTELNLNNETFSFKILQTEKILEDHSYKTGIILIDKKTFKIAVSGGFILINQGQIQGKKVQNSIDLINGTTNYNAITLKNC